MKILDSNKKNFYIELDKIIKKRKALDRITYKKVEKIINDVRINKEKALIYYEKKFNSNSQIIPSKKEISQAIKKLDPKIKKSIDEIFKGVKTWHLKQKPKDIYYKDKYNNKFYYKNKPIESVACYVPGNLPSTLIMCATPALISGVKRIVLCTPKLNGNLKEEFIMQLHYLELKNAIV